MVPSRDPYCHSIIKVWQHCGPLLCCVPCDFAVKDRKSSPATSLDIHRYPSPTRQACMRRMSPRNNTVISYESIQISLQQPSTANPLQKTAKKKGPSQDPNCAKKRAWLLPESPILSGAGGTVTASSGPPTILTGGRPEELSGGFLHHVTGGSASRSSRSRRRRDSGLTLL